ncbi:hypothetical protein KOW79_007955 [Hemibagrus wyckioides]|uniref:Uncharacterized protein n=1 Tax=Hemibagrus wyckioides TaxID=337641 RepID=A0A9D3SKJ6_9TELE|nr:hypothetical protein KOW79_007955 [Hemibagrus wyckioides]
MKAIRMKYDADDGPGVDMEMTRNLPSFHNRICPDENLELVRFLRQSGHGVRWELPERSGRSSSSGTRGAWRGGQRRRQEIAGSYCLTASVKGRHCSCSACDPGLRSARLRGRH